jgi:hypothetical protein
MGNERRQLVVKYKDRDNLVSSLRELADFIEDRGIDLPMDYFVGFKLTTYLYNKEKATRAAKALGKASKVWSEHYLDLQRKFGEAITLEFTINRNNACTVKEVGEKVIPEQVIPERVEKIYEYDCDPILQ